MRGVLIAGGPGAIVTVRLAALAAITAAWTALVPSSSSGNTAHPPPSCIDLCLWSMRDHQGTEAEPAYSDPCQRTPITVRSAANGSPQCTLILFSGDDCTGHRTLIPPKPATQSAPNIADVPDSLSYRTTG